MSYSISEKNRLLNNLRKSRTLKIKAGWARDIGAGFIKEDIAGIQLNYDDSLTIVFDWGMPKMIVRTCDLNLRETEEAIKYLESI